MPKYIKRPWYYDYSEKERRAVRHKNILEIPDYMRTKDTQDEFRKYWYNRLLRAKKNKNMPKVKIKIPRKIAAGFQYTGDAESVIRKKLEKRWVLDTIIGQKTKGATTEFTVRVKRRLRR
jgi:hypothetical protein